MFSKSWIAKTFLIALLIHTLALPTWSYVFAACSLLGKECSISGKVLDNKGKPVKGAKIEISCNEHKYRKNITSGKAGRYAVKNLKPGFYSIILSKGRRWYSRHKMERLEPGQELTIDFAPLKDAAAMCGEVLDSRGKPIPECSVSADNIPYYRKEGVELVSERTTSDEEGFFVFDNLPPGSFDLDISKPGAVCRSPAGKVLLEKGLEKEITIKVFPGKIRGKVKVKGNVPSKRKRINIIATREGDFGGPRWNLNASPDGSFEIQNLPLGSFEAVAYLKGYYCKPEVFTVKKRGKAKEIEISLLPAGTVLFKVNDKNGNPLEGVTISRTVPGKGSCSVVMEEVSDGEFRVFSIEPGDHEFLLNASGIGNTRKKVAVKAKKEVVVTVNL